jgi:Fe-S-cluster containining protein
MNVNKDQPGTWIKYKSVLCNSCVATCCTMPVEVTLDDLIRLQLATVDETNLKKIANRLIKEGIISQYREKTKLFTFIHKANGDCYFLDYDRKCTVYENRPGVCRKFPTQMSRKLDHCPYIKKDRP